MKQPLAFISYRRDDARDWANLLAESIQRHFGRGAVFIDTDSIRVGDEWPRKIEDALKRATVVLTVIGPRWLFLQSPEDGRRRLDVEDDWVRREIEHALQNNQDVIPMVVAGAQPPTVSALPPSIASLSSRQAHRLREKSDIKYLLDELETRLQFRPIRAELDFPTPVDRSPTLEAKEVAEALARLPGWRIEERDSERGADGIAYELVYTFKFREFRDAIHFMSTAARYIDRTDHHPFWENQYKDLRVRISTWDVGLRITSKDVRLAEYLQWLYRDYSPDETPRGLSLGE